MLSNVPSGREGITVTVEVDAVVDVLVDALDVDEEVESRFSSALRQAVNTPNAKIATKAIVTSFFIEYPPLFWTQVYYPTQFSIETGKDCDACRVFSRQAKFLIKCEVIIDICG